MSKLSKVNRKLKAAMRRFIKNEDPDALISIGKLSRERQIILNDINNIRHQSNETE